MSKVLLKIGYTELIIDEKEGFALFTAINGKKMYERHNKWVKNENGSSFTLYHVKPFEDVTLRVVADEDFAVWKLAGESE